MRTMLTGKIHRATVTEADVNYQGSITVDAKLLELADILPNQQVDVVDITNGQRLTTYAIPGTAGQGEIKINGAAARLMFPGDLVIIIAYAAMDEEEARQIRPRIVQVDQNNHAIEPPRD